MSAAAGDVCRYPITTTCVIQGPSGACGERAMAGKTMCVRHVARMLRQTPAELCPGHCWHGDRCCNCHAPNKEPPR